MCNLPGWGKVVYNGSAWVRLSQSLHRWQRRQNSKYAGLKMQRTGSQAWRQTLVLGKEESFSTVAPRDTPVLILFQGQLCGPLVSEAVR